MEENGEQKDLPLPQTNLPMPEKEIVAKTDLASQGETFRSYEGKSVFKSKWLKIGIILVVLVLLMGGVYTFGRNSILKELNPSTPSIPPKDPDIFKGTPIPDFTADWKTYTNPQRGYSFKYPSTYSIKETKASANSPESVSLEKDVEIIKGGGMGGGDALSKGALINFTVTPRKDLSDTSLKNEFGSLAQVSQKTLGGKNFTKVTLEDSSVRYFYDYSPEIFEIFSIIGPSSTSQDKNNFLNEYNQILSTFKFTDSNLSSAPIPNTASNLKAYNSACGFSLSYPNSWSVKKYFITDSEEQCAYLTASNYSIETDSRTGFYLGVKKIKLGSKGLNYTINSLEDYVKDNESLVSPSTKVNEKINKTYGSLNGISYLPLGYEPGRSFIFIKDSYLYNINWSDKEETKYVNEISEIIKSIKFTQ